MSRKRNALVGVAIVGGSLLFSGCAGRGFLSKVDCCAAFPKGFVPELPGTKICNWQRAQVENAEADMRVLYQSDFEGNSDRLSPAAQERLWRQTTVNSVSDGVWVVEPSFQPDLDNARVASVTQSLNEMGSYAAVQLGIPAALGLEGPFAERATASIAQGNTRNGRGTVGNSNRSRNRGAFGGVTR